MPVARAVVFTAVDTVSITDVEIPEPAADEVLVKAAFTGISPGTELRCLAGKQEGSTEHPFIPGYSLAGTVVAAGPEAKIAIGTRVLTSGTARVGGAQRLWGGHVALAVCRAAQVFPLPDSVDLRDASLGTLASIAYHGVCLARPQPHERVAVVGLGCIGQMAARLYAAAGAHVVAADLSEERAAVARAAGIDARPLRGSLVETLGDALPRGADVVVDATGSLPVLAEAIHLAKEKPWDDSLEAGPRYVLQGSYPEDLTFHYRPFFMKEATLLLPRDRQPRDTRAALDLMARGRLVVSDLLSAVRPPEDAPAVYAELRAGRLLGAAFDWR
jgi:2-desacetyl-2-hydroxyethyl bacteriochlorophyllide A dehydrogenase